MTSSGLRDGLAEAQIRTSSLASDWDCDLALLQKSHCTSADLWQTCDEGSLIAWNNGVRSSADSHPPAVAARGGGSGQTRDPAHISLLRPIQHMLSTQPPFSIARFPPSSMAFTLLLLLPLTLRAFAQKPQSACYSTTHSSIPVNISSAFSACSAFQSAHSSCNAGEPPRASFLPCICNQAFLDNIYE
jgi:hypothetical protein